MRRCIKLAVAAFLLIGVSFPAGTAHADQNDTRLDRLFERLKVADSSDEATQIVRTIWSVWAEGPDRTTSRLLAAGGGAMAKGDHTAALNAFNLVIERAPAFAEAFNQRATLYFQMGRYEDSVADIQRTLALEPRHFGALSGLAQIYEAIGQKAAAAKVVTKALEINPQSRRLQRKLTELQGRAT